MDLTKFLGYKPFFDYDTVLDYINYKEYRQDVFYGFDKTLYDEFQTKESIETLMYSALIGIIYVFIIVIVNLLLKREKMDINALGAHFAFGFFCLGWFQNLLLFTITTLVFIILPIKIIYYQDLKFAFKDTIKSFHVYFMILIPVAIMFVCEFKHKEEVMVESSLSFAPFYMETKYYPAYYKIKTFSEFIEKWRE